MSDPIYKVVAPAEWQKEVGLLPSQNPLDISRQTEKAFPDKQFIWATDDKIDQGQHVIMLMAQEGTNWQFVPEEWISRDPGAKDKIFLPQYENRGLGRVYFGGQVLMYCEKKKYEARRRALQKLVDTRRTVILQAKNASETEEEFGLLEDIDYKPPVIMKP